MELKWKGCTVKFNCPVNGTRAYVAVCEKISQEKQLNLKRKVCFGCERWKKFTPKP